MDESDSEFTTDFFSKRAKVPAKTSEELQAALELVNRIQGENCKISEVESTFTSNNKTKRKGRKKVQSQPQEDRGDITDDSFTEVILSSASKRRLKKLHDEQELEMERIEAENQRILSSTDVNLNNSFGTDKETHEVFENITVLTIMYMSKISRLKCYENDKFSEIFPKVAELFNLSATDFLLCLKTKNITVDDTPKSLELTYQDILECIPYKVNENSKTEAEEGENSFKILFQSNDTKKKIDLLVHKVEKMQNIMTRYSEERNIPLDQLIFDFDGERLSGEETPAELDMEPESCIDVTVLVPKKYGRKKKH